MFKGIFLISLTACLIAPCDASAAQDKPPPVSTETPSQQPSGDMQPPVEVKNRMNMDEPMQGGMMKKGMKMGDVAKSAEKKDEEMKKRLEMEEKSMPPMPSLEPKM
jgi:hypothetical protein